MIGRTHYCGDIQEALIGEKVRLKGWAQTRRDLGQVVFIDLRDRSGIVQIVATPEQSKEALNAAERVRNEYVLDVEGIVVQRDEETYNEKIPTGKVEVRVDELSIMNASKPLPFQIEADTNVSEDVRLRYRYLDLRRPDMQETFKLRHQATKFIRRFLDDHDFFDMETPMLTKSTPEGARDYLVPSRVHPGEFYALPQSPQLFKQLLMVSGFERYYQIVRCFRDEDLRADRQPEFTQVDIETAFLDTEDLFSMMETMMAGLVKETRGVDIETPFPRMTYYEAMNRYGSDKPETRFGMELVELTEILKDSDFKVFKNAAASGGIIKGLNVKGVANKMSRKEIDDLAEFVAAYGAKGLAWLKVEENELKGPVAKFLSEEETASLREALGAEAEDLLFFGADTHQVVWDSLGALRLKFGKELDMIDRSKFNFLWVTEFPLMEYNKDEDRYVAMHHPFTRPVEGDAHLLETKPEDIRAEAYDLVLNGYEIGGGSQRIYEKELQERMFTALGFNKEEAKEQFDFLMEAFDYGAPPHGGIAFGLDRIVMILAGRNNLRDTIAFPKTASATDPLTQAPGKVSSRQLEELHLKLDVVEEEDEDD
ncbi:aspartate--tRNA ligase [Marinococcus halophilus]|uniref:Aspartate--tRNA ligase n=1 Tax=Marinococcus halophilus TaxID=1371 RepID=A0A510Y619_MARHA|nr:aspartate--tRNA ligase [Marinococcus halophilus]OZT81093.1 aspartate--tRNA ligase [Marinococcus halophilus]GEK58809.1 aspartate--tRNA(Asp/Asn) ligase [Marinococcus halophilus]